MKEAYQTCIANPQAGFNCFVGTIGHIAIIVYVIISIAVMFLLVTNAFKHWKDGGFAVIFNIAIAIIAGLIIWFLPGIVVGLLAAFGG